MSLEFTSGLVVVLLGLIAGAFGLGHARGTSKAEAKAEQQRPADRQLRQHPQPGGADGAHQGDQHRDPALVAQPMQDQRYRQAGRGGRQLQQAMQRAGLRFAITHTL